MDELRSSQRKRDSLRTLLKEVSDLERLTGRMNLNSVTPRDVNAIKRSLDQVPRIHQLLTDAQSSLLQVLSESTDELPEVRSLIARAIADEPPVKVSEGDTIRAGYSAELDELRSLSRNAKQTIATLEATERHRSGIGNLRIRYNGVFGYYIEISKSHVSRVPADYERRQTLANAERYTTPELKEWEKKVLGAEERIVQLETNCSLRSVAKSLRDAPHTSYRWSLATRDAIARWPRLRSTPLCKTDNHDGVRSRSFRAVIGS